MKKHIDCILLVVLSVMIIILLLGVNIKQVLATHSSFDLVNLREVSPTSTLAYDKIKIQPAWEFIKNISPSLSEVIIGIVDGGIDIHHPEFFLNVKFGQTPTSTIKSDDHGSAVAGIIGADNVSSFASYNFPHMNGIVSGVLPKEKYVIGVRDFSDTTTRSFETLLDDLILKENAQVINLSFGAARENALIGFTPEEKLCANSVPETTFLESSQFFGDYFKKQSSTIFVISAGNENVDIKDAVFLAQATSTENVIIVGGTELNDTRLSPPFGSNYGSGVALAAPATNVYTSATSTLPLNLGDYWHPQNGRGITTIQGCPLIINLERFFEGTSASAPLVTGVAAIIKSIRPTSTPAEIKNILTRNADPLFVSSTSPEADKLLGSGCSGIPPAGQVLRGCRLNALRAVQALF